MFRRFAILLFSAALLLVSGAEAVTGHCAKMAEAMPAAAMSSHCAEMMDMQSAADPAGDEMPADAGACCCVITAAPTLYEMPFIAKQAAATSVWARPANTSAISLPMKVAIPPPRG